MELNIIRAFIFIIAGLIVIIFPDQIYKYQAWVFKKLHIKREIRREGRANLYTGIFFIAIGVVLFGVWLNWFLT